MSAHNDVDSTTTISADLWNDLISHGGAVDGDDFYKLLSANYVIYRKSASLFYVRNGTTGIITSYSAALTAIQAVHDACSGGEKVLLLDATYPMTNYFNNTKDIVWEGQSQNGTILDFTGVAAGSNRFMFTDVGYGALLNMKITGVGTAAGIYVAGTSSHVLIDNVWVLNTDTGHCLSSVATSADILITRSRFDDPQYECVTISSTGGKIIINENKFYDAGRRCVQINGPSSVTVITNIFEGWGQDSNGSAVEVGRTAESTYLNISANQLIWTASANSMWGILVDSEDDSEKVQSEFSVDLNILKGILGTSNNGIYLHGFNSTTLNVKRGSVAGNIIKMVRVGISVTNCKFINLTTNVISFCNLDAININHSDYCSVSTNICVNNGQAGTSGDTYGIKLDDALHNVVTGNICTDDQDETTSDLASDAASGQKDVIVGEANRFFENQYVTISDDTPLTENNQIDTIDLDTNTLTMKNNLANTYTTAQNAIGTGRKRQTHGIAEVDTADYNTIKNNDLTGNLTAGLILVGAHSTVDRHRLFHTKFDLSGAASDLEIWFADGTSQLAGYTVIYTEASSADAGVTIRVGRYQDGVAPDDDYFDTSTSEVSKNKGYAKFFATADLTNTLIAAGDTLTVGSAGGKTGGGEVLFLLKIAEMCST